MSASIEALKVSANKLRKQIATLEATLSGLRLKLAKIEANLTGSPEPISGLDVLWKTAYPIARNRSSKQQCRIEWNRIPKAERPPVEEIIKALKIWNRSEDWKKDGNSFVPGLHKWIKNRCWEDLPDVPQPSARYQNIHKTSAPHPPTEPVTDSAEIAALLALTTTRVRS